MLRKIYFLFALITTTIHAQNITDVLQYGSNSPLGTARYQSMGGAFGALGGDLSSLNSNPAGSAIFNNSLLTFSGNFFSKGSDAMLLGNTQESTSNDFNINQLGGVMVFKNNDDNSKWIKIALAFNYDLIDNFNDKLYAQGNNTEGLDAYFQNFATGTPFGDIRLRDDESLRRGYLNIGALQGFNDQQAFLGYYGGILDPQSEANETTVYNTNAIYDTVDQTFLKSSTGYNSKFTVNAASQYNDFLHLGVSLNFHDVFYERYDQFLETGYAVDSDIQESRFNSLLTTQGNAFSFNVGAIAKLNDAVRLGASYQSPTWYRLTDDFSQSINSDLADNAINTINFDVINIFDRYTIKTPEKLTGSLAFIFGRNGLLSLDYGYQDFSKAALRPTTDLAFESVNNQITNDLKAMSSLAIGGEYRIKRYSLRGGYKFEESPYKNEVILGNLSSISGGLGYNFSASRLDFSVSSIKQEASQSLFSTGLTTPISLELHQVNIALSYTLNF